VTSCLLVGLLYLPASCLTKIEQQLRTRQLEPLLFRIPSLPEEKPVYPEESGKISPPAGSPTEISFT